MPSVPRPAARSRNAGESAQRGERRRRRRRGEAERALHHDAVGPAAVSVGDTGQVADAREAELLVQRERGRIVGIDVADHLPEAGGRAHIDQFAQEQPADAAADMRVVDVDRVLDCVPVGGRLRNSTT
jgi:hypothetical protein